MFPRSYFAAHYFAPRYYPQSIGEVLVVLGGLIGIIDISTITRLD